MRWKTERETRKHTLNCREEIEGYWRGGEWEDGLNRGYGLSCDEHRVLFDSVESL